MRDYAKLAPTFWTGETGKALRRRGSEAVIVALYLVSSPHSNMLGLYYQPVPYMAHETGLGQEGTVKGLQACVEVGFCSYDSDTDMVWVHEMAAWQIADALKPADHRCKGIQKDYDSLPNCPFLEPFFDRYAPVFHLSRRRSISGEKPEVQASLWQGPSEAPPKPGTGTGTGAGTGAGDKNPSGSVDSRRPSETETPKIPCPYGQIVDAYHRELPDLPKVRLRDGPTWVARQKAMRSLWGWVLSSRKSDGTARAETAEQAVQWIAGYFARARDNDFVMGRRGRGQGHENWRADFDYLVSPKGLKQVIEKTQDAA